MNFINRIENRHESCLKSHKGKIISGKKERATKKYFKDLAGRSRRKQGKTRFDTFRRSDQPDSEDERLEDIHFANFLGIKNSVYGVTYNGHIDDSAVNIHECDILRPPELEQNAVWNMNWHYDPDTQTLTGTSSFKRARTEEEEDIILAKRSRSDSDSISKMEEGLLLSEEAIEQAIEETNFEAMVAYMRQQIAIAQKMEADELYACECCR